MDATTLKIIAVVCMTLDHLSNFLGAPLLLYNGKGFKRFFYIFYPAHIFALYIIGVLIAH